ncbi:MAG: type II toxin-antitoxin system HicB family antitoxin [Bacteroidales bacterium]
MNKYLVIFEETNTGYSAYVPDLPGCIATGKTKDETEKNIYEAIQFHLEGLKRGKTIPRNKSEAGTLYITSQNTPRAHPLSRSKRLSGWSILSGNTSVLSGLLSIPLFR